MKTSKPFSTISYNTSDFLKLKLDELIQRRVIEFYCFIPHLKEDDETKDHIHLLIFPNGQYQTDALKDYLLEIDTTNLSAPPLGIMPVRSSTFGDWYLYSSHDVAYLTTKSQKRKYHYTFNDFISSNSDYLNELIHTIDRSKYDKVINFVNNVKNGLTFEEMAMNGAIPMPQFNQFEKLYSMVYLDITERNGRVTHSPITQNQETKKE